VHGLYHAAIERWKCRVSNSQLSADRGGGRGAVQVASGVCLIVRGWEPREEPGETRRAHDPERRLPYLTTRHAFNSALDNPPSNLLSSTSPGVPCCAERLVTPRQQRSPLHPDVRCDRHIRHRTRSAGTPRPVFLIFYIRHQSVLNTPAANPVTSTASPPAHRLTGSPALKRASELT
jgi:hypothetical protein